MKLDIISMKMGLLKTYKEMINKIIYNKSSQDQELDLSLKDQTVNQGATS